MIEQNDKGPPQSRVKKDSSTWLYAAVVIVVLLIIGSYFLGKISPSIFSFNPQENPATADKASDPDQTTSSAGVLNTDRDDVADLMKNPPSNAGNSPEGKTGIQADTSKDFSEQTQQQPSGDNNYRPRIDEVNSFYTHIDQQPYVQKYHLKEPSKVHFSKLLQKLIDNPPVVLRETDDLFTLLQNTAHFFRLLGKENIKLLKEILSSEQNSLEHTLKSFYSLTYTPEYLKQEYSLSIPPHALTDYAAFFLNTMGGRLYLFRRDSHSRMLVSYYSIMTIDRANKEGNGGHGIDLRPAIASLIEEIENGGRHLQLREEYLDALYDLQEKYN